MQQNPNYNNIGLNYPLYPNSNTNYQATPVNNISNAPITPVIDINFGQNNEPPSDYQIFLVVSYLFLIALLITAWLSFKYPDIDGDKF